MGTFHKILTSEKYIKAYGFNNKGILYIEDYPDLDFWQSIIDKNLNLSYEVKCYSKKNTTPLTNKTEPLLLGKRNLEKLFPSVNNSLLVGIDADYDYLLEDNTPQSIYLKNKFILHTYGFSRESILCTRKALAYTLSKIKFSIPSDYNLNKFLNRISIYSYKYLPMFLFYKKQLNEKDFHSLFHMNDELISMVNDDSWKKKKKEFNDFFSNLTFNHDFDLFKLELKEKGFNKYNAYQFICGHTLMDNIIYKTFIYIKNDLNKKETKKITTHYTGKVIGQRKKQLKNHFENNCSFKTNLNNGLFNNNDNLYLDIIKKAESI